MAASKVIRLKLLIDKKGCKVLFAEAGKDFVDFLFHLLSLPAGTIVKLLREKNMVGCLSNLYGSIENLSETYMQQNRHKNSVLNPRSPFDAPLLLSCHESNTRKFYSCPNISNQINGRNLLKKEKKNRRNTFARGIINHDGGRFTNDHFYVADVPNLFCPCCNATMSRELSYVYPLADSNSVAAVAEGGFVKGVVTYMIMDNLEVIPMSTISTLTLLNKFNVKDVSGLEEKVVDVGMNEGLRLLKGSLECKTALTSVFLGK